MARVGITPRTLLPVLTALVLLLAAFMALGMVGMEQALHARAEQEVSRHALHFYDELEELANQGVPHDFQEWLEDVSHVGLVVELYSLEGELLAGPREGEPRVVSQQERFCAGCHIPGVQPSRTPLVYTAHEGGEEFARHAELVYATEGCTGCHLGAVGLLVVTDSTEGEEELVRQVAFLWVVGGLLALAVLGLLTSVVLRAQVLHPILNLQRRVARVRGGELAMAPTPTYEPHEVGDLARDFDDMVVELAQAQSQLQELLGKRTAQVEELSAHLRELQVHLLHLERMATIGELSSMLAHEVRNPLNALSLNVQLATRASRGLEASDKVLERLDLARTEISRLDEVLQRYLALGKRAPERRTAFDLTLVCAGVGELVTPAVERAGSKLRVGIGPMELPVLGDEGAIWQILINLVNNAIQAGAPEVRVSTVLEPGEARVVVSDDGPGIPEEHVRSIFEPFFTSREGGSGLGLPISRRLAREHGGDLVYTQSSSGGATFILSLPLAGGDP